MNDFDHNISIIAKKWPQIAKILLNVNANHSIVEFLEGSSTSLLYKNIQIASNYNAQKEANIQSQQITPNSAVAHLYGTGLGHVQAALLARETLHTLHVYILNVELFITELSYFNQTGWLNNAKVCLHLGSEQNDIKQPFIALPAEVVLADDSCANIRDLICLELDSAFINENNSGNNEDVLAAVNRNMDLLKNDDDILSLVQYCQNMGKGNLHDKTFVIAATGPTLEYHYSWLREKLNDKSIFIIALDASVKPLLTEGIIPDVVISIDKIGSGLFENVDLTQLKHTPLVYFPLLEHDFLQQWPNKRFVSYSTGSLFDKLNDEIGKTRLFSAGSVIHPAVDLAVKMKAQNIILLGADFSLVNHQTHASKTEVLSERILLSAEETPHWVLNGRGERVPTYLNFRGYLRDLERFISLNSTVKFYTGSFDGADIKGTSLWPDFLSKQSENIDE